MKTTLIILYIIGFLIAFTYSITVMHRNGELRKGLHGAVDILAVAFILFPLYLFGIIVIVDDWIREYLKRKRKTQH